MNFIKRDLFVDQGTTSINTFDVGVDVSAFTKTVVIFQYEGSTESVPCVVSSINTLISLTISATETVKMIANHKYKISVTDSNGIITTVASGTILITRTQ